MAGPYLLEEEARGRRRAAAAAGGSGLATARPCISLAATARAETRERGEGEEGNAGRASSQQKGTARRQNPFFRLPFRVLSFLLPYIIQWKVAPLAK
jgi:hypothetical protein